MQLVQVVERGERAPMSKRRGEFVTLDELIDEIGVDAARFFMLQRSPDTPLDLDLDLARERSQRTRSTTSSTRTRGSRASCATRARSGSRPRWPTSRRGTRSSRPSAR